MAGRLLKSLFGLLRLRRPHTRRSDLPSYLGQDYLRKDCLHSPSYYRVDRLNDNYLLYPFEDTFDQFQDKGVDNNHWLIQVKEPVGSRDEIVDCYVKLVAQILGSEDEARKNIYSVSTKYYFAIGLLASKGVANKFKLLPDVIRVIQDAYVDRATKDYGGEPFVDGKVVTYDPKHHDFYFRVQARIRARKSGQGFDLNLDNKIDAEWIMGQPKPKPKPEPEATEIINEDI